ncbi:amidase family protein [Flavobacteriaceae bacterium]|nr:amidase family protein [Flavobacteriaceae bacterium]MDA7777740.1 amidase family protein [Flavobacteriaceae bacterium]
MRLLPFLVFFGVLFFGCESTIPELNRWGSYDETEELIANADHPIKRMQYKRIQSQHTDRNSFFIPFKEALLTFNQTDHDKIKSYILEQDIPTIQKHVKAGRLTYEQLTLFYLFRIYKYELDQNTFLNAIISLNPNVLDQARKLDQEAKDQRTHPVYGMPILLKDNIDALPMATTAGAAVMAQNYPEKNAFIVEQLRSKGALILGKVNMSEWAYYFCQGCPVGYSAMGGQTLNPYGRRIFETGGSSSGSGVAVAANYAVAAIGSETSGSILSPSGKNSLVGLKPTIGAVSRSGIVPISSSMDTAGPMTKNVIDNAILMSALVGEDPSDAYSFKSLPIRFDHLDTVSLKGFRLGLNRNFEEDSLMKIAVAKIKSEGAEIIPFTPAEINMNQFRRLLDVDMRADLPQYFIAFAHSKLGLDSVKDVVDFNAKDIIWFAIKSSIRVISLNWSLPPEEGVL